MSNYGIKTCEDADGNKYKLIYQPYESGKGYHACHGCDFLVLGKCKSVKSCTPKDDKGNRLVKAGYLWKLVKED